MVDAEVIPDFLYASFMFKTAELDFGGNTVVCTRS